MESTDQKLEQRSADSYVFQLPQKQKLIACLLLALATFALYSPVTRAPFLNFDDGAYVTDNPHVRAGLSWNTVDWAFRTTEVLNWHPITWLSHALDCQIFGMNPAGPHTINVLLHAANAVLLFLLLASATGLAWRSLAVAALFALHPINVESVAWISERKNVLSMLFFLIALAAYGWYARRPGVGRYLAVTVAYALGLMTKPQVITFPFALLLLDYWPLCRLASPDRVVGESAGPSARGRTLLSLIGEKVPWFALSAVSGFVTMKVQADATQVHLSPWVHLGNAAIAYVQYLGKAFWPVNLAPVYPHPISIRVSTAVLCAFVIAGCTTLAVIFRDRRPIFVAWFWFLGTMVPMIGLVQVGVQSMADRYAYIPLLGIFVIVCWGTGDLIERWHVPRAVAAFGTVAIVMACGFALHRQAGFWSDNVTLWTHTLELTERNYTAEDNLATALIAQGKIEEAVPHLRRARSLRPDDAQATLNLATYEQMRGNYPTALDGYAQVLQFTKDPAFRTTARINSGYAHLSLKQYANAQQDFDAALIERPGNSAAYRGHGLAAQRAGDIARAIQDYERSAELEPSPVTYLLLAQALELTGRGEAARAAQAEAARTTRDLNDDLATAQQLLAN